MRMRGRENDNELDLKTKFKAFGFDSSGFFPFIPNILPVFRLFYGDKRDFRHHQAPS